MRRAFRVALLLTIFSSGFAPTAGRAVHDDPACSLADDRPAYVCAGAMTYRNAYTTLSGKGLRVTVFGFEGIGALAPTATTRTQGGCLLMESRSGYAEMCDLPFEVTFEPTLEAATVKGTVKSKQFGTIVVDLTFAGTASQIETVPAGGFGASLGCGGGGLGSIVGHIERPSQATGTLRVGRTTLKAASRPAVVSQLAGGGGEMEVALPCAAERLSWMPRISFLDCFGYFDEQHGAGVCRSAAQANSVTVTGKSKTTTVRLTAADTTSLMPSAPDPFWYLPPGGDPSWFSPSDIGTGRFSSVCISVGGRGFGFGMCDFGHPDDFLIEIDPALRSARLKGEIPSPYEGFYPRSMWLPSMMDFGRVYIDVTLKPEGGLPKPVGRTFFGTFGSLCGAATIHRNVLMQGDGGAEGYIVFKRRHGSYRGNASKPLPSTMESSIDSFNLVESSTSACSRYSEVEPA